MIEVMVTTAVLSLGIVLIYESFFICLDAFERSKRFLVVLPWAQEKMVALQDDVGRGGCAAFLESPGEGTLQNKDFRWNAACRTIDEEGGLYQIDLTVTWPQGKGTGRLVRSAYAGAEHEDQEGQGPKGL